MMNETEFRRWLKAAGEQLPEPVLERTVRSLSPGERMTFVEHWPLWTHDGQEEPTGDWRVWVMMAGRGFGKTRAGAEWVSARARETSGARIALVGASVEEVVKVMVKGESGLIAVARTGEEPAWLASKGELRWPDGACAFAYSGDRPDKLRGPEHHFAWCDELAKWRQAEASWNNLMMGLRLGGCPRTVVTTTPRPVEALKRIVGLERTVTTGGRTADNPHLPEAFRAAMARMYGGTRLGRQELDGHLFEDVAGALWTRELIEAARVAAILPGTGRGTATRSGVVEGVPRAHSGSPGPLHHASHGPPPRSGEDLRRIVIAVDPPASADGDACGIVACGLGSDGVGYVLGDHSIQGLSPGGWAAKVARAAEIWGADRVIAEANNGGGMVEAVLRGACVTLPVRLVHASASKTARAEPVAALFESGMARLAGRFPELEDQLCGLTAAGGYEGPGRSPDRADAMVYALSELLLGKAVAAPRVRVL